MKPADAGAAPARPASLVVIPPSGARTRVPVRPLPFSIGRHADNQLVLRDNRISRAHARIVVEDGEYQIEDLRSRHGVFVNGTRVERAPLRNGDRIEFGFADTYQLLLVEEEAELKRILAQFASGPAESPPLAGNLPKLRALLDVARALQTSLSTDDVLAAVVDAALAVTGSERGFLLLRGESGLEVRAGRDSSGRPLDKNDLRVPTHLIGRALRERRELLSLSFDPLQADPGLAGRTVADLALRSVVAVPLVRVRTGNTQETAILTSLDETVGALYMDSRRAEADLSAGNREILQTLALEASTILENARLLDEERVKQRMEEELRIARQIQQSLLPRQMPVSGWFRAAGSSVPSHQVGGDYFDVHAISPSCWFALVADVSGKGVSSALLASLLQGAFLTVSRNPGLIGQALTKLNVFLNERTGGEKYATLVFCTLEAGGALQWVNAGHCPALLLHEDGRVDSLPASAFPLGMLEEAVFTVQRAQLAPGDKVVLYTDGLSEAQNPGGEYFGEARIRETARAYRAASCEAVHDALAAAVEAFTGGSEQRDDITVVVFEYRPD